MTRECPECGDTFETEKNMKIHCSRAHEQPWKNKETLERLYHGEGLDQAEIADKLGCDRTTIIKWMDEFDIETDWIGDPTKPVGHGFRKRPNRGVGNEYELIRTNVDGEQCVIRLHRLIAVAHGILDPEDMFNPEIDVHHKSRHGLDNRPGNLEALEHGDHTLHHNIEQGKVPKA